MEFFNNINRKKLPKDDTIETIDKIRQGDNLLREEFIDNHKSFIMDTILHVLGKSTLPKNSPEFDIGLDAFNHSIDNYDIESSEGFLLFSEKIIKEWVLSYVKEQSSNYSLQQMDDEKYYLYCDYENTKEISHFKKQLWEFGIRLNELPYLTPSDSQSIDFSLKAAKILSGSNILIEKLFKNKSIPVDDLDESIKQNKKIIDKYKEYILALTLVLRSNLRIMKSYIKNIDTGKEIEENTGLILEASNEQALLFTIQGKFIVIRHNKSNNVGKQTQFGNYRVRKKEKTSKLIIAAWAITSIIICFILYRAYIMVINTADSSNNNSVAYSNTDNSSNRGTDSQKSSNIGDTTEPIESNNNEPEIIIPEPSPEIPAVIPENTDNINPSPSPAITKAEGVPGEVRISADIYKVTIGQDYTVHMYMKNGNNGTTLILYQNDKEYVRYNIKDNTPRSQAKIVTLKAEEAGTFTYRWELINDFGATSSKTIIVRVMDESVTDSVYSHLS